MATLEEQIEKQSRIKDELWSQQQVLREMADRIYEKYLIARKVLDALEQVR